MKTCHLLELSLERIAVSISISSSFDSKNKSFWFDVLISSVDRDLDLVRRLVFLTQTFHLVVAQDFFWLSGDIKMINNLILYKFARDEQASVKCEAACDGYLEDFPNDTFH